VKIDYVSLSSENLKRYGTDVGQWAPDLLANLYHERTHFVFELLQNAEDALRKRGPIGSNSVRFELRRDGLLVSHWGKPFDEADVRGICGISKSTKKDELTAIGRFGIGFKSVYAVTDQPQIRSAGQHFGIKDYVHPVELADCPSAAGETSFWFPFRKEDDEVFDEIAEGLKGLDARTLMFLRHVDEVDWNIDNGPSGTYCRQSTGLEDGLRKITLIGTTTEKDTNEEQWLVFDSAIEFEGSKVGAAEIAFYIEPTSREGELKLATVSDSRLVAFFPTSVQTNLGILLQAPYRTTPARDNIPPKAPWNQYVVEQTACLLTASLERLRDMNALSVEVLLGLPLDDDDFSEGSMFRPLYDSVAEAIRTEPLLPKYGGGWLASSCAVLARGQELCELLDSAQLTTLFESEEPLEWLADITLDRTPELRRYLMYEHDVREIQAQTFVSRVTKGFLESQSDEWICKLYEFLSGQSHLWKTTGNLNRPWVRLENGTHVVAYSGEQPNAFLPSKAASGFPTVRASLCNSKDAISFLRDTLELTEPDPVDDVIANILPLYQEDVQHHEPEEYREHLRTIESAFENLNTREKLVTALKTANWIPSVDNEGNKTWTTACDCYLPTERLKLLFEGVPGINFVDDSVVGLQGESMRRILIACGSERYLDSVPLKAGLSPSERLELRKRSGEPGCTHDIGVDDRTLRGLAGILNRLAELPFEQAAQRSQTLWDALADVVQDKRQGVVTATYSWFYYSNRSQTFDADFIRTLKQAKWIPTSNGNLATPDEVIFEQMEPAWTPNAVLQAALKFRPSALAQLAEATGLNLDVLSKIKKSGLTDDEVLERLGLTNLGSDDDDKNDDDENDDEGKGGESENEGKGLGDDDDNEQCSGTSGAGAGGGRSRGSSSSSSGGGGRSSGSSSSKNSHAGRREFFSYLKTHPVEVEDDEFSDSETYEECMKVEGIAIDYILGLEPELHRTSAGNKGFDLYGTDEDGQTNRWIEVKAMVGTLANHPVGMSKAQFEMAQEKKGHYWLYIVENAKSEQPRILRIQDPAGLARCFTFDEGWREIALVSQVDRETGEVIS